MRCPSPTLSVAHQGVRPNPMSGPAGRARSLAAPSLRKIGLEATRARVAASSQMANRLHKLLLPWLLICTPVWAARLPVPPLPPAKPSPVRVVHAPHRGSHASAKAVSSRRTPVPPMPPAGAQLVRLAPMRDRDIQPPPDPNSSPHTKVSPTDFHLPKVDADAGYPYGARYRSPEDTKPIDTPGFTLTIPLRLP